MLSRPIGQFFPLTFPYTLGTDHAFAELQNLSSAN